MSHHMTDQGVLQDSFYELQTNYMEMKLAISQLAAQDTVHTVGSHWLVM